MVNLITEHIDIWTAAQTQKNSGGRGRGKNSNGQSSHGIKKLRELILNLAVRGKLVPQGSNDEPASELLEKIAKEKARLIKEGKIKKSKKLPGIGEDEKLFELPEGWEWARIGDVGHNWGQKKPDKDFTYIEVSGIDNVAGVVWSPNRLTADQAPSRARKIVKVGTVIYSTVRPYLQNICVIEQEYSPEPIASTAFAVLHPFQHMPGKYFTSYLRSPVFVSYVESVQTGIAYPAINDKQFFSGVIPIPPLAEQQRIVAKVDKLVALCDQLEQQQTDSNATHQTLLETLLVILTSAANQKEFAKAWQRISKNFDTLFITEQSIDQLKQTILQLAVMGKLVSQDPNDEPAIFLLEKIAKEKARLIKEGKIKKQKPLPEIGEEKKPLEIPPGWEFVRFGNATFNRDAERIPLSVEERRGRQGKYDYYGASGVIDIIDDYLFNEPLLLIGEDGANLINRSTPIAFIARGKYWVNNHAHVIDGLTEELLLYICLHINAISLEPYITGTAQPKMNQAKMNSIILALPPLAEQQRIVAKVDKLMALCDVLQARLYDTQTSQVQLADAIVEQAVA